MSTTATRSCGRSCARETSEISQVESAISWLSHRTDPARLAQHLARWWKPAPHLLYMAALIAETVFDPAACKRLAILAPPRHGKSGLTSLFTPIWFLEWFPWKRVVLTSYGDNFAGKWGGRVRDMIEANPQKLRLRVRQDVSARHYWELEAKCSDGCLAGGGMITAGAGGAITGEGGELFIIDDPHKNWAEATSKTHQDKIWDWYTGTARDRLDSDEAVTIATMQRWSSGDFVGRLRQHMEEAGEEWRIVDLPALAEEGDLLSREIGDALWPGKISLRMVRAMQTALGSFKFSAKFQQRPRPDEGDIFKKSQFKYFRETELWYELVDPEHVRRVPKDKCWRFQTCDPAAGEKQRDDYFALLDVVVTPTADLLFSDILREHARTTKHKAMLVSAYERFTPSFQGVENKDFGLNIIQHCTEAGLPIKALKADTDKVSRARTLQTRYEAGAVYHRAGAPWLQDFEDELIEFPNGEHDDQVDVAAYAALCLPGSMSFEHVGGVGKRASTEAMEGY